MVAKESVREPVAANTTSRPRCRHRWWWLLLVMAFAGVVITFQLLVNMQSAPAVDMRFVGEWTATSSIQTPVHETFEFLSNGQSTENQVVTAVAPPIKTTIRRYWLVDGEILRFVSDNPRDVSTRLHRAMVSVHSKALGVSPRAPAEDTWRIVKITEDIIQLQYTGGRRWPQPELELRRTTETPP